MGTLARPRATCERRERVAWAGAPLDPCGFALADHAHRGRAGVPILLLLGSVGRTSFRSVWRETVFWLPDGAGWGRRGSLGNGMNSVLRGIGPARCLTGSMLKVPLPGEDHGHSVFTKDFTRPLGERSTSKTHSAVQHSGPQSAAGVPVQSRADSRRHSRRVGVQTVPIPRRDDRNVPPTSGRHTVAAARSASAFFHPQQAGNLRDERPYQGHPVPSPARSPPSGAWQSRPPELRNRPSQSMSDRAAGPQPDRQRRTR